MTTSLLNSLIKQTIGKLSTRDHIPTWARWKVLTLKTRAITSTAPKSTINATMLRVGANTTIAFNTGIIHTRGSFSKRITQISANKGHQITILLIGKMINTKAMKNLFTLTDVDQGDRKLLLTVNPVQNFKHVDPAP